MTDVDIKIRFNDETGEMGFAINRDKKVFDDITETLKLIAALEILKDREKARITKTKTFSTEFKNGDYKITDK